MLSRPDQPCERSLPDRKLDEGRLIVREGSTWVSRPTRVYRLAITAAQE